MKDTNGITPEFNAHGKHGYESTLNVANNWGTPNNAIFWGSKEDWGTLSLTEAQELIEVLQAIIADYPKGPTNEEILNELPVGSIIQFNHERDWFKARNGWVSSWDGSLLADSVDLEPYEITVKYRGDE